MIEIKLSPGERRLIQHWIETMKEKSGHWGDGTLIFPDEEIIEKKIEAEGTVRITRHHLELILEWSSSSHGNIAFTVDELQLINKIKTALAACDASAGSS